MIKALFFDINGTLSDILTDESNADVYRTVANFLDYQGVKISPERLRTEFWRRNKQQRGESLEAYPEFDVTAIFRSLIADYAVDRFQTRPAVRRTLLPEVTAEVFRAASRFRLELYADVQPVLEQLARDYRMAAVSDGQSLWARAELESVGLGKYFEPVIVSGDFGFRKPDNRLFQAALDQLGLKAGEVIFVGNDMYRDVGGAAAVGMRTVWFRTNQGDQRSRGVKPDYIIYHFAELPEAVRFLAEKEVKR